jgi:predicted TIM-barrel fold metal-dependent hydrolase
MTDKAEAPETILEPDLPIVDPHHHLWDRRSVVAGRSLSDMHLFERVVGLSPRYFFEDLMADVGGGHNVRATVFVQCGSMYRADGPVEMRPIGETEYVNGAAAQSASGLYGPARVCAGIVGHADLLLGDAAAKVLEAHIAVAGGRFRGVRHSASWDADPVVLGPLQRVQQGLYRSDVFRAGFARLAPLGLSFDAWLLEPQLDDLIDLAGAFPETPIILDHLGTPLGIGGYAGRQQERFGLWRKSIDALARLPNVTVKLGGLAMPFIGLPGFMSDPPLTAAQLAKQWYPWLDAAIEAFGPDRCMFESNFPVDRGSCTYATLWNAFKHFAAGYSPEEKTALFSGTAARVYRLAI